VNWQLYRLKLPVVIGALSVVLIGLDVYFWYLSPNAAIVRHSGAPIWPYRMPQLLLLSINAPVYLLTTPLLRLAGLHVFWVHQIERLPFIVLWWYWVGRRLDLGLVPSSWLNLGRWIALIPVLLGMSVAYLGLVTLVDGWKWWSQWGGSLWSSQALLLIDYVVPSIWWFVLAAWLGLVAVRIAGKKLT
jgi:hypothetical protein